MAWFNIISAGGSKGKQQSDNVRTARSNSSRKVKKSTGENPTSRKVRKLFEENKKFNKEKFEKRLGEWRFIFFKNKKSSVGDLVVYNSGEKIWKLYEAFTTFDWMTVWQIKSDTQLKRFIHQFSSAGSFSGK